MNFDFYLSQARDIHSTISISSDWMQGRASFGGLVAALVFARMQLLVDDTQPARCLQTSFVGPVDDSPLDLTAEILRKGKNVTHVMGKGYQNGEVKIVVQASFGASRESSISLPAQNLTLSKPVSECQKLPYIENEIPEFTKHFDFQYLTAFPFANAETDYIEGYLRFNDAPAKLSEAHLLGLIDAWPPTTLPMMASPCMASSLSWTVEFIQPMQTLAGDEYTQYRADIMDSREGYGYARAQIANSKGEIIALSQQTVTHFA